MSPVVSGQQLALWRNWAQREAIASDLSPTEVDWLLQEISDLTGLDLRLEDFKGRSHISLKYSLLQLTELWQKRLNNRVPLQYLVGSTPWRNFNLLVSPHVLIPRPETELIIDIALEAIQNSSVKDLDAGNWLDLGTGSGAIALGLAKVLTKATIYAIETSEQALAIAEKNVINLGLKERVHLYQGDWWQPVEFLRGQGSGMVSNPPYIPTKLIAQLQPEVVNHEPHLALDGGEDGLKYIRHLVATAPEYLRSGGIWLIEMMAGQGEQVRQLLEENGNYQQIQIFHDLAGLDRFVLAYRS
jgi:release factor glutamine methyltransferase